MIWNQSSMHCTIQMVIIASTMMFIITSLHPSTVIGKMDNICGYSDTLKFKNEAPEMCCPGEKIKLPESHSPHEPKSTLLSGDTSQSKQFLSNIRKYNSCFQMTYFSVTNIVRENCMSTFKVVIVIFCNGHDWRDIILYWRNGDVHSVLENLH